KQCFHEGMDDDALLQVSEHQRREPQRSANVHPVRKACLAAAVKLVSLTPTRIVGEPDMADARGLIDDLDAICTIVDPVVAAIGAYAEAHFGRLDQLLLPTSCTARSTATPRSRSSRRRASCWPAGPMATRKQPANSSEDETPAIPTILCRCHKTP